MKYLLILSLLYIHNIASANELQWVDEQIAAIKPPRSGITKSKINTIKSPFVFLNKQKKDPISRSKKIAKNSNTKETSPLKSTTKNTISKRTTSFSLGAIINKSALINGTWYKLNAKVGKYTLSSISSSNVILSYKKKELLLSTRSKNRKLKFKNN
ncbi:hypothetical protein N9X61_01050 [Sulfurimonas sp.]|nr:hypothetical protein [Sulfurimonas sp.]